MPSVIPLQFLIITFVVVGRACVSNMRESREHRKRAGKMMENLSAGTLVDRTFARGATFASEAGDVRQTAGTAGAGDAKSMAKTMAQAIVSSSLSRSVQNI